MGRAITEDTDSNWEWEFGVAHVEQLSSSGRRLKEAYEVQELHGRSFPIKALLTNDGTAAATHVLVELTLPFGLSARINRPDPPSLRPDPSSLRDPRSMLGARLPIDAVREHVSGIKIKGSTVQFKIARVGHKVSEQIPAFWITISRERRDLRKLEVPWEIRLDELAEPVKGSLTFLLKWTESQVTLPRE